MATEPETPRITQLHVRMDCNGCGNKIRKTLSAIDGVSEVYIDQATHKITVVGMADLERIVKAIRKTKRIPTIFSHTDPAATAAAETQPPPPADGEGEAQQAPPPADPPAADAAPPAAAEKAAPAEVPAPENKEAKPAKRPAEAMDATVVRVRTVHEYPYGYGHGNHTYSEHWAGANHPMDVHGGVRYQASPYYHANATTHSYNSHRRPTSPYVAEAEHGGYGGFPVQGGRYYNSPAEYYPRRAKGDDTQITCIFSDENPNACSIA